MLLIEHGDVEGSGRARNRGCQAVAYPSKDLQAVLTASIFVRLFEDAEGLLKGPPNS
jgi:hypothetical protein